MKTDKEKYMCEQVTRVITRNSVVAYIRFQHIQIH